MVDTLASGASARKGVEVQVLSWAPLNNSTTSDNVQKTYKIQQVIFFHVL
jgi:hypothetical protein